MLIEVSVTVKEMLMGETLFAGDGVAACIANDVTVL